ncbi:MAG: hypothetical protein JSR21_06480 [Proteobacteria bacterium]|nr:hypothetical protein [Pseudomonadota bacterium]
MRTFRIEATDPGEDTMHLWCIVAVGADGTETRLGSYGSLAEAEAAKLVLDRQEADNRS